MNTFITHANQNKYNKMTTLKELREYGRFLGIRGLWRKNKEQLQDHLFNTIHEEINNRMLRRPDMDPDRAYMEAELALRSKKLTRQKTWRSLHDAARAQDIPINHRKSKTDYERELLQRNRDVVEKHYRKRRRKTETVHSVREWPGIVARAEMTKEGGRVKEFRITGNQNWVSTRLIMDKITPHIEMRTKVVYSFEADIYRGAGEIVDYKKTLNGPPGMFTSLAEIQAYIEECEQKRLDLDNEAVWSKAYLPATRTTNTDGNYQGKVMFKHTQIRLIASNEPLMGCGPLPEWLSKKRCIYAVDQFEDNLCVWRCLVIYYRFKNGKKNQVEKRTCREAEKLAQEYYGDPKLRKGDVRATKLVDFEGIAKHHEINIMLYEPKKNKKEIWQLVYGKVQYKKALPTVNIGLFDGHCFYIKDMDILCKKWECKGCKQIFTHSSNLTRHTTKESCNGGQTKAICKGQKFKHIMNSSEKVFYGGSTQFSYAGCQWIEAEADKIGKHIHHAMCGHGGERQVTVTYEDGDGNKQCHSRKVDGYEPETNTVYQFHGCNWHGCPCLGVRTKKQIEKYRDTEWFEEKLLANEYNVVSIWECGVDEADKKDVWFEKEFTPYPHAIVFDTEAIMKPLNEKQTEDLTYLSKHIQVSVGIHDTLNDEPTYIVASDPKELVEKIMEELVVRRNGIVEEVLRLHPLPSDFKMLPGIVKDKWLEWVGQVPVFGFNSGKYDIPAIKEYFAKVLTEEEKENIIVAKKDNKYMFLMSEKFKFLDVVNYIAPGFSYDAWCKSMGCKQEKLVFPYEWLTSYEKLDMSPSSIVWQDFVSSLDGEGDDEKGKKRREDNAKERYEIFVEEYITKRGCETMHDVLRVYNLADVEPFVEALDKTRKLYYPDKIDMLKDAVSIPGISMTYVLNKALEKDKNLELYAPGDVCAMCNHEKQTISECSCDKGSWSDMNKKNAMKEVEEVYDNWSDDEEEDRCWIERKVEGEKGYCVDCITEAESIKDCKCKKTDAYELLKTGMVGGPSQVFCRYHEKGVTAIRSHVYGKDAKLCKSVLGLDANMLYPFSAGLDMPCGKETLVVNKKPYNAKRIKRFCRDSKRGKVFGFAQVDAYVPDELYEKFSEFPPFFVVMEIPEECIPQHMKDYREKTGRKKVKGTKKLCGVMKAMKILLYTPLIKWYLNQGLQITAVHQLLEYQSGRPFAWFPEEVAQARREADKDPENKQVMGDTAKIKANSFYGKMIEDKPKQTKTVFTKSEVDVDTALRSPFFEDLEEVVEGVYEIKERKRQVVIDRPYQCGIAVYQLAKLRMLEFYYDFLDKYIDRRDFELCYMDTDSMYMALSGDSLDDLVKPELREEYEREKAKWLVTDEYSKRTGGLFKLEFQGTRGVWLTNKCYLVQNQNEKNEKKANKYSCKGVSKKQNDMTFERYKAALQVFQNVKAGEEIAPEIDIDKAKNTGFRVYEKGIVTYDQIKLGLSAYYDKRVVLDDGIHTRPLQF